MALHTTGTSATTSLTCLKVGVLGSTAGLVNAANVALINAGVFNDQVSSASTPGVKASTIWPGALLGAASPGSVPGGGGCLLHIPNRGVLQCFEGDIVAIDSTTGWPILISNYAFQNGPWNKF